MSEARVRRILRNFVVFTAWVFLATLLHLAWGWGLLGSVALIALVVWRDLAADRPSRPNHRKRVGPRAEWID
jgi:hypothetical protein